MQQRPCHVEIAVAGAGHPHAQVHIVERDGQDRIEAADLVEHAAPIARQAPVTAVISRVASAESYQRPGSA